MSSMLDWLGTGNGASPTLADVIGPQTDGTNTPSPTAATIPNPTDTAGGSPANYTQAVLDIFKFGVGQYSATVQQQNMLDYKRYEATNGGLFQQGKSATLPAAAAGGKTSGLVLMAVGALVVFALLTHKA